MDTLMTLYLPMLLEALFPLVGTLAMAAITFLAVRYRALTGVEMDEKFKLALHGALMNAIRSVLMKNPTMPPSSIIQMAINQVSRSNPDAMKRFGLDEKSGVLHDVAAGLLPVAKPMVPSAAGMAAEQRAAAVRQAMKTSYPPTDTDPV